MIICLYLMVYIFVAHKYVWVVCYTEHQVLTPRVCFCYMLTPPSPWHIILQKYLCGFYSESKSPKKKIKGPCVLCLCSVIFLRILILNTVRHQYMSCTSTNMCPTTFIPTIQCTLLLLKIFIS